MNLFTKSLPVVGRTWLVLERCQTPPFCVCGTTQFATLHRASTTLARGRIKLHPQLSDKSVVAPAKRVSILRDPGVITTEKLTKDKVVELLAKNVVYRKGVLVAISKPQGLSVAGTQSEVTLLSFLPDLGMRLGISEELHVIKAATKESSGLVLLSSCHTTTKGLEDFFMMSRKSKRLVSTYCAVTVGIPDPDEGEIVAALKSDTIGEHHLVIPVKDPSQKSLEMKEVKKTQTYYKVLDSSEGCALVQLQPVSAFQSQLQVHATLKLCTVLGDHVYSARVGKVLGQPIIRPLEEALPRTQALEEMLLQKMCISQAQMHRMPLHLHLHQLMIQDADSRSIKTITAPPPPFFLRTLQLLGLTMKE